MRRSLLGFLCAVMAFAVTTLASAHDQFEITTSGRIGKDSLSLVMTLSRSSALALVRGNPGTNARFEPNEFEALEPELLRAARDFFVLTSNGKQLALREARAVLTRENDVEFTLAFEPPAPGPLRLSAVHLGKLSSDYGNVLNLSQDEPPAPLAFELLRPEKDSIQVNVLPAQASPEAGASAGTPEPPRFGKFLSLGVEHILTGYDHLLFLAGLLFACHTLRGMLILVSCFTVAHSITLSLAALNVLTVRPSVVEPLIAASIVVVGVENLLVRGEPKGRWAVTLAFGLLHGLGFASVLQDLGVGATGGSVVVPLLAFNLGVELGQLLVAAIVLPLLFKWRRAAGDARAGLAVTSVVVSVLGAYWLIERTLLS